MRISLALASVLFAGFALMSAINFLALMPLSAGAAPLCAACTFFIIGIASAVLCALFAFEAATA